MCCKQQLIEGCITVFNDSVIGLESRGGAHFLLLLALQAEMSVFISRFEGRCSGSEQRLSIEAIDSHWHWCVDGTGANVQSNAGAGECSLGVSAFVSTQDRFVEALKVYIGKCFDFFSSWMMSRLETE